MPFLDPNLFADPAPEHLAAEFLPRYFAALGARTEWSAPGVLRAELTRDQLCELEQRPRPTWYTAHYLPEISTLYLNMKEPPSPAADDRCESGLPGSRRFELARASVRRIGPVTRLCVVPRRGEPEMYRPFWVLGFEAALVCSLRRSRLIPVAVDLVTGAADGGKARTLLQREVDERHVPPERVRRRGLRYKDAYEIACEWVKEEVAGDPATWDWYYQAQRRLRLEESRLNAYYGSASGGQTGLDREHARALEEVRRRCAPRVEARLVLAATLLYPEDELA